MPEPEPGLLVRGQHMPVKAVRAHPADFDPVPGTAVLHYYGAGGWLIQWGKTYVLTAPYFSNYSLPKLLASSTTGLKLSADVEQLREGVVNTPIDRTSVVLLGHGHVDHVADVPALLEQGLITGKPALIADRSVTNALASIKELFSCVAPIDYREPETDAQRCPLERVRITPIHHAHAPHLELVGLAVAAFGGRLKEPLENPPQRADEFKLGYTWAYLIDLLDAQGKVVFRIHYVDASGDPPHGLASKQVLAERDVDVHIACVPGFEQTEEYPDAVLSYHRVKYALLGHWEDFLQPPSWDLAPLRQVLTQESIERFIDRAEGALPKASSVQPGPCLHPHECGPRGAAWAMPVPGETYRFTVAR
ncbi:MAG: MBL fold metallo-hydrolase [Archangiaceae bacterium]|nr:MBL fold metallo-hydrolase [Archangiaceae bacterium]